MSDLTRKIAAEHQDELDQTAVSGGCTCGVPPGDEGWFARHVAQVTEDAVRAQIARDIDERFRAEFQYVRGGNSAPTAAQKDRASVIAWGGVLAARIAEGTNRD